MKFIFNISFFNNYQTIFPSVQDGPSNILLYKIKQFGGESPNDWHGYSDLGSL